MKKLYIEPEMDIVYLEDIDIICASGCTMVPSGDSDDTQEGYF